MKQKIIVWGVAIVICAIGFPFYWGFTHGPDDAVDGMFLRLAANSGSTGKEADAAIAPLCVSKETADMIATKVGFMLAPIVGADGYEYDIVKTAKNGDDAIVSVKLHSGSKSVLADFKLKKTKDGDPIESILGRWVLTDVDKSR